MYKNIFHFYSGEYFIAAGTSPDSDDVKPYTVLAHSVVSYCLTGLQLQHNTSYYVSLITFNGATESKNVSATSHGGKSTFLFSQTSALMHGSHLPGLSALV